MVYNVEKIMRDVRVALDQNNVSEQLIVDGDLDTLTMDEIIRSKIEAGVFLAESEAPVERLQSGHNFGDVLIWCGGGCGWVELPDDFMRLIAFRMSDWERTVREAISCDDPRYARQSSRYGGIRGNWQKPVCAIVMRSTGRVLEFYSCKDDSAQVVQGVYLPRPHIDRSGGIEISRECYQASVYAIGSLVLSAIGEHEKSDRMSAMTKALLG